MFLQFNFIPRFRAGASETVWSGLMGRSTPAHIGTAPCLDRLVLYTNEQKNLELAAYWFVVALPPARSPPFSIVVTSFKVKVALFTCSLCLANEKNFGKIGTSLFRVLVFVFWLSSVLFGVNLGV